MSPSEVNPNLLMYVANGADLPICRLMQRDSLRRHPGIRGQDTSVDELCLFTSNFEIESEQVMVIENVPEDLPSTFSRT